MNNTMQSGWAIWDTKRKVFLEELDVYEDIPEGRKNDLEPISYMIAGIIMFSDEVGCNYYIDEVLDLNLLKSTDRYISCVVVLNKIAGKHRSRK